VNAKKNPKIQISGNEQKTQKSKTEKGEVKMLDETNFC